MGACISRSVDLAGRRKTCARMQSKHIVIFDTLIKERKPAEVEAVLGNCYIFTIEIRLTISS